VGPRRTGRGLPLRWGHSLAKAGDAEVLLPAFEIDVVDTTGCGDAFTSGFISGLLSGLDAVGAAESGLACGSLVATGLGSDAGIIDLAQVEAFRTTAPRRPAAPPLAPLR
jgi:sugar/nucleoside kinase (ribokinase family)